MENDNKQEFNKTGKSDFSQNRGFFKIKGWGLFSAMFWAFFIALALSNVISPYFSQIINGLLTGLAPVFIGIAVAFIFSRMIDFIERVILKNAFKNSPYKFGIKRTISITISLLVIVAVFALIISILVPKILEIIQRLTAGGGDGAAALFNAKVDEICDIMQKWFGAEVSQETVKDILKSVFDWFMQTVAYLNNLMSLSISVLTGAFNFIMGIMLSIFFMKDKEKISKFSRRFTYASFKKERADELCVLTKNATNILYNYIICKVIEFAFVFVSLGLTFYFMGLEFAWEAALIIGVFNFIPYFGVYIGTFFAALITLIFNSINSALYLVIATIVVTTIEFNTIIPFITGKRLKVSALVVIVSTFVGSAMFGVGGMLFAPPIAALFSVIVTSNIEMKENRMKYLKELNDAREKNKREEMEQLGIVSNEEKVEEVEKTVVEEKTVETNKKEKADSDSSIKVKSKKTDDKAKLTEKNKTVKKASKTKNQDKKEIVEKKQEEMPKSKQTKKVKAPKEN